MSSAELNGQTERNLFDLIAPINFEELKKRVIESGPIKISDTNKTALITIDVVRFSEASFDDEEHAITVVLASGFTSLSTLVSPSDLAKFKNLGEFASTYFREPYLIFKPSGEIRYIEDQVNEHLGVDVAAEYNAGIPKSDLELHLSEAAKADPWLVNNLEVILDALLINRGMRKAVGDLDGDQTIRESFPSPNDFLALMEEHYNLGFLTARLISEHFVRYEIEPLAVKGLAQEGAQKRRNEASGKSSKDKRHQRIEAMLTAIENLCEDNPVTRRLGIRAIADLAIEDAVKREPTLWKQGAGRRDEYLDEMKSDTRYQERFKLIAKKTA